MATQPEDGAPPANIGRRVSAVLAADAVSFGTKMERDPTSTVGALIECRRLMSKVVARAGGRVVASPGDFLLVEFETASSAVDAALDFVRAIAERNSGPSNLATLQYRVGLGFGEVIETDNDLLGVAINMAARLQQIARPQQILVPTNIHDAVKERPDVRFHDLGEIRLKHIEAPIRVFEVRERDPKSDAAWRVGSIQAPARTSALARAPNIHFRGFRPLGDDERYRRICEGLTQQLSASISSLTPRITLFEVEPPAEEQPWFMLSGTAELEEKLIVTAKLTELPRGRVLWANQFTSDLERRLDVQSDIVRNVIAALQISLTEGEQARFWHQSTRSLTAWESFQRGKDLERQFRRESHRRARDAYEAALLEDPGFVSAIAALAFCHVDEARLGWSDSPADSICAAEALAARAAGLRIESADLYTLDGFLNLLRGKPQDAVAAGRRAIGQAPRSAEVAAYVGAIYRNVGAFAEAIELYQRAQALSPVREIWIDCNIANVLLLQGRHEEAAAAYRDVLDRDPEYLSAHVGAAAAYARLGQLDAARRHARQVHLIDPPFDVQRWSRRFAGAGDAAISEMEAALRSAGLD